MSSIIDNLVLRLKAVEIPVFRASKQALAELQRDPKASAAGIAAIVLPDPMMVLQLMRLANASRRGEFTQRITTVEHAVMLLGFSTVFSRLAEAPVMDEMKDVARQCLLSAASRACHAAFLARDWAVQRLDTSPEEVYIAALLHSMAEFALWAVEPAAMERVARARRKQSWEDAERDQFGCTLAELSLALAEEWNMPPLVISAIQENLTAGKARPNSVMLANSIVRHAETGWWQPQVLADLEQIAAIRRLSLDEATADTHRLLAGAARRFVFPDVVPAAAWLPMLEGEWPDDEIKLAVEQQDVFQHILEEISRRSTEASLSLSDLLTLIIRALRDGVGMRRIVFALLTKDRNELKSRYVYGAEDASPLKAFHFDMRQRHLFSVLMTKQQAVWISRETRAKYAPIWSEHITGVTSGYDFYAMSLSVHGKVVGMLYGDSTGQALDAVGYEKFKQLCTQAASGMAKLSKPQPAA